MLTDANGQGLRGTKKLEFNIYDAATGGGNVWGPQVFSSVPVINGQFNVILGTTDTDGRSIAGVFGTSQRFLGIEVNNSPEIAPRQQILSTPYAIKADNGVPVGTIVAYFATTAPDGWLFCNGQAIPADSKYDALRVVVTGNNMPDLRGRFPFTDIRWQRHNGIH
jgi:hypothetical protein